jgi:hypothetical protein
VLRVVSDSAVAVAEVEIVSDAAAFRCAGFWTIQEDMLHSGVEYWVTVGGEEPPPEPGRHCELTHRWPCLRWPSR